MTHCEEPGADFGGYSRAIAAYSGLKAGSLAVRSGRSISRSARESAEAIVNAGKVMLASVEYGGMVSASLAIRTGTATGECMAKVFAPVASAAVAPFFAVNRVFGRVFHGSSAKEETLGRIEARLKSIEDKLDKLERGGVRFSLREHVETPAKEIGKDRKALLRALVDANLSLRETA